MGAVPIAVLAYQIVVEIGWRDESKLVDKIFPLIFQIHRQPL